MATTHDQHSSLLDKPKTFLLYRKTALYLIFSFTIFISSVAFLGVHFSRNTSINHPLSAQICRHAYDEFSCLSQLSELTSSNQAVKNKDVIGLLRAFLEETASKLKNSIDMAERVIAYGKNVSPRDQAALLDCVELMGDSLDRTVDSMEALENPGVTSLEDAHTWLSSVLTSHETCSDGLNAKTQMNPWLDELTSRARTGLTVLVAAKRGRDYGSMKKGDDEDEFPWWVRSEDRRLLGSAGGKIKADVVVAKDGSGKYKTVKEAVKGAPENYKGRYVIYVKKGKYEENVDIGKKKKNMMLVGDGKDFTIITGHLNVVDGTTTFKSATVAAVGDGFIAQDIWFQNTAGPKKHQAVALRVGADISVIYRCRIDAYQDTLYAHSNRQFYRDNEITGTVDFIFGNAAVVFQNCKLIARKPLPKQANMVTAQGRIDPNQNTGTSIQNCNIIASQDLEPVKGEIKSYLGRPWKEFSRTVVMESYIGDHIDPAGWSEWNKDFALKTLYYGEYLNKGPGSGTSKRVKWPGFHVITCPQEAKKFTVGELIQGGAWLKSTGVPFKEGL